MSVTANTPSMLDYQHQIIDFIWARAQEIASLQVSHRNSPATLERFQQALRAQVQALTDLAASNPPSISGLPRVGDLADSGQPLLQMIYDEHPDEEAQLAFNRYYSEWNMDVCGYVRKFRDLYPQI